MLLFTDISAHETSGVDEEIFQRCWSDCHVSGTGVFSVINFLG